MDLGLVGKRVLITGASSGIGKTVALMLAEEGASVILHYRTNKKSATELKEEIGRNAEIVQADLSNETEVKRMFNEIATSGRIDVLVCNAGIWPEEYTGIVDMDYSRWKNTMAVDLDSVCGVDFRFRLLFI